MTDTAEPASENLVRLSPRDEARLHLAVGLDLLVTRADEGVPVRPDVAPGDLLRHALDLQRRANQIVENAVVAERERGTTWDQIGEASNITRQSAHERWQGAVRSWASTGRTALPTDSQQSSLEYAAQVDRSYATRHPDDLRVVTGGLDATRFPGSREYEHSLRTPGTGLHARLKVLSAQARGLHEEFERLQEGDDSVTLAENRDRLAGLAEEQGLLYQQLVTHEPTLAEEHSAEANRYIETAKNARSYAAMLRDTAES
ncbi:hypothetical protein ACFVEN_44390 [Streptomyces sp. NPDC057681]|uniref:hypothetical protein n=1 Tax=Streptomyces sp. NPDC057681 TaxID=3346209 RepID=UPI0036BADF36